MLGLFHKLFTVDSLSPHGICLLWRPELIWTHAISDAVIGLAYFSIPIVLATFISRRPDVGYSWVVWAFVIFILACATTHFLSIITLWVPVYGIEALVKAVTAAASIATAIALWFLLPRALAVPSPALMRTANEVLEQRVRERDEALNALRAETAERQKAESLLRHAQRLEAIGQLTGGVAHDFNNLLTAVIGNLEVIGRHAPAGGPFTKALANASLAADRAATLTQQLLAFSRKQPLQPQVVDVADVTHSAIDLVRATLGKSVEVRWHFPSQKVSALVDPIQLGNALINLAVNARDAMPDGGVLSFRVGVAPELAEGENEMVTIEVSDTGTGMSAEIRDRATEPFFTTKPVGRGSGLGLSQVHGFVAQSRGRLEIDSSPGIGTTIRILLPKTVHIPELESLLQ